MSISYPLVIADSGSTKTDWAILSYDSQPFVFQTSGINPALMEVDAIISVIREAGIDWTQFHNVCVRFFGAGCIPGQSQQRVSDAIQRVIDASSVEVDTDLMAACIALHGNNPGIACILGTGANSCLYNGSSIVANTHPLGFILGDEGSGAYIGKRLLSDALKGLMANDLADKLIKFTGLDYSQIISRVYRKPFPNRFLASLTRFAADNIERDEIRNIILESFISFIDRNITPYGSTIYSQPISAVGSVAFHFEFILAEAIDTCGLQLGQVIQSPLEGLIDYYSSSTTQSVIK